MEKPWNYNLQNPV